MPRKLVSRPKSLLSVAFAVGAIPALSFAQILQTHAESLTSYLPAATAVQGVRPIAEQRGTRLEGSMRKGSTLPFSIAGNPFEGAWGGTAEIDGAGLHLGAWAPTEVDISLPAPGFRWVVGRTYNSLQYDGGQVDSQSAQGINWHQSSQPEIVFHDDATGPEEDLIYLVYGADRFAEFKRTGSSSNDFQGVNGASGVFVHSTGSPDTFKLTDQTGLEVTFFGFNTADADHKGQLWKITDPAANTAYVGSTISASAAISAGYDSGGRITLAYDTAGRSYAYTYSSSPIGGYKRLETVVVTSGGGEVARVTYGYYPDSPSITCGEPGDLRTATVTMPLTDSGINDVRVQHYRYWEGSFDAGTNPGYPHAIQLVVQAEGARRYEFQDATFDDDILSETTANLRSFGSAYFEYDSSRRISEAAFNGDCGCGGAGSGTFTFRYETNAAHPSASGYDEEWQDRASVQRPDGTWLTQYFDEIGQSLSQVITAGDPSSSPGSTWVTAVTRNANGCVTEIGTPASLSSYTHNSGSPAAPDGTVALSSSVGLVNVYVRVSSGDLTGFLMREKFREAGTASTDYMFRQIGYDSLSKTVGSTTLLRPVIDEDERYEGKLQFPLAGEGLLLQVATTAASSPNTLSSTKVARTIEAVDTAENGANVTAEESSHVALDGTVDFHKSRDGRITYREYTNGLLTKEVDDANTTSLSPPTGFSHTGTAAPLTTLHTFDAQGHRSLTTLPDGRVTQQYYTILKDRRRVTLSFTKYVSGSGDRYGPVGYTVTNHAGKVEASGVIALSGNVSSSALTGYIDEMDADPISAVDVGTVAQLHVSRFDDTGTRVDEERA